MPICSTMMNALHCMLRQGLLILLLLLASLASAQQRRFPFPDVPQSLVTAEARLDYVARHYWDKYDFASAALLADKEVTEQGFVNYLDLLSRMDASLAQTSADAFAAKAFARRKSAATFESLMEHYLENPESPLRNDAVYACLLRGMRHRQGITATDRQRLDYKIKVTGSNLPGHAATDFAFIDRQGRRHRLGDYRRERVLLFFYDPDCDNCHRIAGQLRADARLHGVRVLAIYPDSDTQHWKRTPQPFPTRWTDGYSPQGEITSRQLYYIRATPTLMLIAPGGKVELKDPSPDQLLRHLAE